MMKSKGQSPIILLGSRFLSPYIMVFGMYVIFHGHYSPGGGFQGGTLLAASILLIRISAGRDLSLLQFREWVTTPLAVTGVLIYFGTGLAGIIAGGYFLDYEMLPFGMEAADLRYWGILIVEVGIGLTVMAVLVLIFDNMVDGEDYTGIPADVEKVERDPEANYEEEETGEMEENRDGDAAEQDDTRRTSWDHLPSGYGDTEEDDEDDTGGNDSGKNTGREGNHG